MKPFKIKYIPRAIYYMSLATPLRSLFKITFTNSWKNSSAAVTEFTVKLSEFLKVKQLALTSHARISLFHILKYLDFPEESEIILSPISLAEMLKMIHLNRLKPVFVGFQKNSFNLDLKNITVGPKAKVFLYTPIAGIHTDLTELKDFCKKHELVLILDLTQSFGGTWQGKALHEYADFSFFSLCDLKTLHTHRGGAVISQETQFFMYMNKQHQFWFVNPSRSYFAGFALEDFISVFFLNRNIFNYLGKWIVFFCNAIDPLLLENITAGNGFKTSRFSFLQNFMASGNDWTNKEIPIEQKYRFTDLQAEIGLAQIPKLNNIISKRKKNILFFYSLLNEKAQKLMPLFEQPQEQLYWRAPLLVNDFLGFQKYMLAGNIDLARSNLPWLPSLLKNSNCSGSEMKNNCVYIPIYHYLTESEIKYVAHRVNQYANQLA